jgi:hypothetical protein
MSQALAQREIERFLSTPEPEVLSISGRWGVGKTYAWDAAIKNARQHAPLKRYAYVSAFGLRSIDALKTAIVQSTVLVNAAELEPTIDSFVENITNFDGIKNIAEQSARRGLSVIEKIAAVIPYAGSAADILAPGANLLIRNQIICIDDIERSGQGLDVSDILGLVSSLRERRGCKIVLLLNEEGLGDAKSTFREYLEKAVDQAIRFEPTAEESAAAALSPADPLFTALSERTITLGITNIRVIRRIRRFLSFIEPELTRMHAGVTERVIQSIALLGWSVFEPKLAPKLSRIEQYNLFTNSVSKQTRSDEDLKTDTALAVYEFSRFEDIDTVILAGLQTGGFDKMALKKALSELDTRLATYHVRLEIERPWNIYRDSFIEDANGFVKALVSSVEDHAAAMNSPEMSDTLRMLRELGREDEARRLVSIYVEALKDAPREFFEERNHGLLAKLDPAIEHAFNQRLLEMPIERDPFEVLLRIGRSNGWNPEDTAFLSSISVDDYYDMLKMSSGRDLTTVIATALQFRDFAAANEQYKQISGSMTAALRRVSAEGPLNAIRVRRYLDDERAEGCSAP